MGATVTMLADMCALCAGERHKKKDQQQSQQHRTTTADRSSRDDPLLFGPRKRTRTLASSYQKAPLCCQCSSRTGSSSSGGDPRRVASSPGRTMWVCSEDCFRSLLREFEGTTKTNDDDNAKKDRQAAPPVLYGLSLQRGSRVGGHSPSRSGRHKEGKAAARGSGGSPRGGRSSHEGSGQRQCSGSQAASSSDCRVPYPIEETAIDDETAEHPQPPTTSSLQIMSEPFAYFETDNDDVVMSMFVETVSVEKSHHHHAAAAAASP